MSDYKASHTALGTAYLRAAHQLLDAQPLLFDDSGCVAAARAGGIKTDPRHCGQLSNTRNACTARSCSSAFTIYRGPACRRCFPRNHAVCHPRGRLRYLRSETARVGEKYKDYRSRPYRNTNDETLLYCSGRSGDAGERCFRRHQL